MSRYHTQARFRSRAVVAGAVGLTLGALALIGIASPKAEAAFTTGKCAGENITGRGASFARDAHTIWNNNFKNNFCTGTPGAGTINVAYEALGSGAGRTSVKVRTEAPRFGMTDEPPTPTEIQQMNLGLCTIGPPVTCVDPGDDPNPDDNGLMNVVPAAVGAVLGEVNFPNGCDVMDLDAESRTDEQNLDGDGTPDDVVRVRFTQAEWEAIWARQADSDFWHEVFPELAGDTDCEVPIIRVPRFDESGTSFAFKDALNEFNGARGWATTFSAGTNGTREWPNAFFGTRNDCAGTPNGPGGDDPATAGVDESTDDTADHLATACSNGNGPLTSKLIATDGSVGYSDVSTARNASPSLAITPEADDNDTYWAPIEGGSGGFVEPTADANGFRTDGLKGSNCQATTFTGVPDSTMDDWTPASGVNSPAGWPICTLTYGLVFQDNADVWGGGAGEETKARTVFDYWQNVLSDGGQAILFGNDYAPLPAAIRDTALNGTSNLDGINDVDWTPGVSGNPPPPPPPPPPDPPGEDAKASNNHTIGKKEIDSKKGTATIEVTVPGPGQIDTVGDAKVPKSKRAAAAKKVKAAIKDSRRATADGTVEVPIKVKNKKAKKALKKKGKLKVNIAITFSPDGGDPNTESTKLTLKKKKK